MPQDARETESEKRIQNTLNKPCRVELQQLQTEIVIIDPNKAISEPSFSPINLSRESQTSMNTSEFEHQ